MNIFKKYVLDTKLVTFLKYKKVNQLQLNIREIKSNRKTHRYQLHFKINNKNYYIKSASSRTSSIIKVYSIQAIENIINEFKVELSHLNFKIEIKKPNLFLSIFNKLVL